MDLGLEGKVALVTAASRGLGAATAAPPTEASKTTVMVSICRRFISFSPVQRALYLQTV